MVAVEFEPRAVGKAPSVTCALPPMLMEEELASEALAAPPAESEAMFVAVKVPPVRLRLAKTAPVEFKAFAEFPPRPKVVTVVVPAV